MKRKRKRYSASFKAGAVSLVKEQGRSAAQASKELGISETALRRWIEAADVESGTKDGLTAGEDVGISDASR